MKEVTLFRWNNKVYKIYWDTAMDGKVWCRVKVLDGEGNASQYGYYFRTKKAAKIHIIATNPLPTMA